MNLRFTNATLSLTVAIALFAGLYGCSDLFRNPLQDKETGDDITVLLIDWNFITTKLVIRLEDMTSQTAIDQEQVEIRFMGKDASDLIDFSGYKKTIYTTSSGMLQVASDPNIPVSDKNPLELTIVAVSANYASAPQFISFTTEGTKNLIVKMIRKTHQKSSGSLPYSEPFDITFKGVLNSPELTFIDDISDLPTGIAYDYLNMYSANSGGAILCSNLKDPVLYDDFGVYYFGLASGLSLVPPDLPVKNAALQTGDYVYTTVLKSGIVQCESGLTIQVEQAGGNSGTGVFGYLIMFADGQTKTGQITCTFPSDNLVEPVYYPAASPAVKVELYGDAQYDMSPAVNLPSACGAKASFTATPKAGLKTYKFVTQYSCPNSMVGLGLTILGEFRKSGTTNPWTSFQFIEGVCELQLQPGADYDFRINIDGEYHSYALPTDVTRVESYLRERQNEDYSLLSLSVSTTETLVTITAAVQFSQGVCDAIQ